MRSTQALMKDVVRKQPIQLKGKGVDLSRALHFRNAHREYPILPALSQ